MMLMLVINIVIRQYRPAPASASVKVAADPSWGVMREQTLMLERPAQAFENQPAPEIRWVFGGFSPAQLRELFQSSDLSAHHQALLLDETLWQSSGENTFMHPPLEVVRDLDAAPRQRIYDVLAHTAENVPQRYPYVFRGSFEDWFAGSELPASLRREVRRMTYEKDHVLFFADLPYFQLTASSNEVLLLARQVSRVPAVMAKLKIKPLDEFAELKSYWLPPGRASSFNPLIFSLARRGSDDLNISALLPPLPRLLLYRYPGPSASIPRNADCVWTSMNFFNEQPDPRFVEQEFSSQTLQTQYRIVPKADALGDIILLHQPSADGNSKLIHMCVQVADDLVFTKNGGDIYQPWVLMHLEDVRALFSYEPVIETTVFRRRGRNT